MPCRRRQVIQGDSDVGLFLTVASLGLDDLVSAVLTGRPPELSRLGRVI